MRTDDYEMASDVAAEDLAVNAQAAIENGETGTPTAADYTIAFTPRNVAVGLAIVAGLVALAASPRRRSRRQAEDA